MDSHDGPIFSHTSHSPFQAAMAVVGSGRLLGSWARALPILLVLLHLRLPQRVQAEQQPEPAVASGVQQVHLAQGKDPTTMVISGLTPNALTLAPTSQVREI